jgi:adenylate cyclase
VNVFPLVQPEQVTRSYARRPVWTDRAEQEVVILFADLHGFTQLAETRLPYDVVFILNRYFQEMGHAIETAGGYIDKFIGDAVMALFGLEIAGANPCIQALKAARLMFARLEDLNSVLAGDLDEPLRMGIGIHVGPAVVGEIGYGRNRSLTAIGDAVNIASRLQTLSKTYGCELVISDQFAAQAGLDPANLSRQELVLSGRHAPLSIRTVTKMGELPSGFISVR